MANDDVFRQPASDNPYYASQVIDEGESGYVTRSEQPLNPWASIWTRPRATIRQIVETNPAYMVLPLAMAAGLVQAFDNASTRNMGDRFSLGAVIGAAVVFGPVGGIVSLYLGGWLLRVTGGWLGGKAIAEDVRAALAWGHVPAIASLPIIFVQILIYGEEMFTEEMPSVDDSLGMALGLFALGVTELALAVWSIVALVKCLAEVHEFSAWRALGTAFLGFLILFGVAIVPIAIMTAIAGALNG